MTNWFRAPGGLFLTQYTNFVRIWAGVAGLKMIQDQANKVNRLKGQKLSVITSYSIHYTKLYELASISSITEPAWGVGRVGLANMLKATPTVAAHVVKGIIRTLYSRQGKQANASFGRDLLNVMGMAINPKINEKVEMLMVGDRITSYNVCYTKLLRITSDL